jgi:hypothetical protein
MAVAGNPLMDTSDFEKGSAFRDYLEEARSVELECEAGLRAAAAEIRSLIRANKGQMNPNAYLIARRVSRPLVHAADLHVDAAKMMGLCLALHRGAFPPVNANTGMRRSHDGNA